MPKYTPIIIHTFSEHNNTFATETLSRDTYTKNTHIRNPTPILRYTYTLVTVTLSSRKAYPITKNYANALTPKQGDTLTHL